MPASSIYLIATVEIAAVLLLLCLFLVFQNRSLKVVMRKLQERMEQLVKDLRAAKRAAAKAKNQDNPQSEEHSHYKQLLNKQIEMVRDHHKALDSEQDIALDIDPETPLPRRVAALRYAMLQAEKEATANKLNDHADWKVLQSRYQNIFDFIEDYSVAGPTTEVDPEEMESLRQEITNAKKRINNLERFKALYFDLEEKWEACKDSAETHIHEITQLTADSENAEAVGDLLQNYQATYNALGNLIEGGVEGATIGGEGQVGDDSSSEVKHLRAVAADQHKIITDLQEKLQSASTSEERELVVNELQDQLQKQIRFVQESETCIQLLEDELNTANKEMEQLQSRINMLPQLKTNLKDLRDQNDDYEMQLTAMQAENRRLKSTLKDIQKAPPVETGNDSKALKKELAELESRYAELEEKFLNLKLGQ